MLYRVTVSFGKDRQYLFKFAPGDLAEGSAEQARRWFDKAYAELGCASGGCVGKVLIIDKILNVARCGGEQRFIDGQAWGDAVRALYRASARARYHSRRRRGVWRRLLKQAMRAMRQGVIS